jgi:hypothetical protein
MSLRLIDFGLMRNSGFTFMGASIVSSIPRAPFPVLLHDPLRLGLA